MVILQTDKQAMDTIFEWLTRKDYIWQSGDKPWKFRNQYLCHFDYNISDWVIDSEWALIVDVKPRLLSFAHTATLKPENGIVKTDKEFLDSLVGDMLIINKGED